jgi:HEPN domain-containing protein
MRNNEILAKEWFNKGSHDFKSAQLLYNEGGYTDTICYLAHQAVEKYLKGFLVLNNVKPEKIHNLGKLVNYCQKINKDFAKFKKDCKSLTPYYIEARYPIGPPIKYPREEAKKVIDTAEEIINFIQGIISR